MNTHRRLFHIFFSIPLIITRVIISGMEKKLWNKRLCEHHIFYYSLFYNKIALIYKKIF